MREIKFRAWNPKAKLMSNAVTLQHVAEMDYHGSLEGVIWMQYTGHEDRKGKEIYEGDLVKCADRHIPVIWCDEIGFDSGGGCHSGFYFNRYDDEDYLDLDYHIDLSDCEIAGNIHENPELLK